MRARALRNTALALCAAFALMILLSVGIGLFHSEHQCTQSHCRVCAVYRGAQFVVRILGLAAVLWGASFLRAAAPAQRPLPASPIVAAVSPISLSVRMNN